MAIPRGDRIGESQKLNRRPAEVGEWYALFVKTVPDDFGRFRVSPGAIAIRMHPRREPTPGLLKRVKRMLDHLGRGVDEADVLYRTWVVDGVVFGEMTDWKATGNRWHRTPEPPWGGHVHGGSCLPTAIHRANEWGQHQEAERLSLLMKEIRERKATEAAPGPDREPTGARPGAHRDTTPPSPPSPPLPPSPLVDPIGVVGERALESPASGNGRPPAPPAQLPDHDPARRLEARVASRCLDLARKTAAVEGRAATQDDVTAVLAGISGTKAGKTLSVIRGATNDWLETTLKAADHFEADLLGAGLDLLDVELPAEEAQPPPDDES